MKKKRYLVILAVILLVFAGCMAVFSHFNEDDAAEEAPTLNEAEEHADIVVEEENNIPDDVDDAYLEKLRARYLQPILVMGDVEAAPGEEVTVRVLAVNNPGILGMCATLSYDENTMTLERVENGKIFNDVLNFTTSETLTSGCRFLWDGLDIDPEKIEDGEVIRLFFKIKESAKTDKYPITLIPDEGGTVDRELKPIELAVDCGYITVK